MSRKSNRRVPRKSYQEDPSYPDGPAQTPFEKLLQRLDLQAFPSQDYARVDSALTYALFSTKRRAGSYRSLILEGALQDAEHFISKPCALAISHICTSSISKDSPTYSQCRAVAQTLQLSFPKIFKENDAKLLTHLLLRYSLLYSNHSLVRIQKTSFDGIHVCAGLKASSNIPVATDLLTANGSTSIDLVTSTKLSVIQSHPSQLDVSGPRLILGPFRFANHDCKPNCQIRAIPSSHAFTLTSIRSIDAGETITVSYTHDGYFDNAECRCASCQPDNPPAPPHHPQPNEPSNQRKRRRGGKRGSRQKRARQKREENHPNNGEEQDSTAEEAIGFEDRRD